VSGALAERAFAEKLRRVGLADVTVVERRSWAISDCARYPLFDAAFIALMERLIPPVRHDCVASVVTFTAHKPPL
jgi:arsenite methyltransferase